MISASCTNSSRTSLTTCAEDQTVSPSLQWSFRTIAICCRWFNCHFTNIAGIVVRMPRWSRYLTWSPCPALSTKELSVSSEISSSKYGTEYILWAKLHKHCDDDVFNILSNRSIEKSNYLRNVDWENCNKILHQFTMIFLVRRLSLSGDGDRWGETVLRAEERIVVVVTTSSHGDGNISHPLSLLTAIILLVFSLHWFSPRIGL